MEMEYEMNEESNLIIIQINFSIQISEREIFKLLSMQNMQYQLKIFFLIIIFYYLKIVCMLVYLRSDI